MSIAEATNNVLGKPFSRKLDAEAAEFLMTCLARLEPVKTEEPVPRMEPDQVVVCIILDFLRFNDLAPHKVEAYLAGSWAGQVVAEEKRFRWPVRAEQ